MILPMPHGAQVRTTHLPRAVHLTVRHADGTRVALTLTRDQAHDLARDLAAVDDGALCSVGPIGDAAA